MSVVKRYCPNGECPSQRRNRKGGKSRGRYLGEDGGDYGRHYCLECKTWFAWKNAMLVEWGELVMEDCL